MCNNKVVIATTFSTCCLLLALNFNFSPQNFFENIFKFFGFQTEKRLNLPTQAKPKDTYTLVLVGDSMTHFLGDGTDMGGFLKNHYPNKEFSILNYGYGATNILSIPDRLEIETKRGEEPLEPILNKDFDIIFLESMGNNPLSHLPLEEGLKKHDEVLDDFVKTVHSSKPEAVIIFVATIAPSKARYGEGVVALNDEQKKLWVEERVAYIKNHIKYAQKKKIPLINIYEKTLKDGDGNIDYLSGSDFIHPSPSGIILISQELADFLFNNKVLPQ